MEINLSKNQERLEENFYNLSSAENIADLLEIAYKDLIYYLYRLPNEKKYCSFEILKKNGETRIISTPTTSLKILQHKLHCILSIIFTPKFPSHGFVKGKSIKTNASIHVKSKYVLNIDLENFFPSINFGRVRGMFMAYPYRLSAPVATVLSQICCYNNELPQGAPTSPIISNMICAKLDSQLGYLAKQNKCFFTRYADDITFSTSKKSFPKTIAYIDETTNQMHVGDELKNIIKNNGFIINNEKVWLRGRDRRQTVTGLIVNDFVNVTRKYKNQVRAMLHALKEYGPEKTKNYFECKYLNNNTSEWKCLPKFELVLKGKIEYIGMIRGHDSDIYLKYLSELKKISPNTVPQPITELDVLYQNYQNLKASDNPQERGYKLENLLNKLFMHSEIITQKSFTRNEKAEQIDGAFKFDGWYYIVECKWREKLAGLSQLDALLAKVNRSGKQTMGLFLSIKGCSEKVPEILQQNPDKSLFLMNGDELEEVLKDQIDLREVLKWKLKALNIEAKPFLNICNELKIKKGVRLKNVSKKEEY